MHTYFTHLQTILSYLVKKYFFFSTVVCITKYIALYIEQLIYMM